MQDLNLSWESTVKYTPSKEGSTQRKNYMIHRDKEI